MNVQVVARVLAGFTAVFTGVQVFPLLLAFTEADSPGLRPVFGFAASIVVGTLVSLLLALAGRGSTSNIFRRESIALSGICWFVASMLGAIPFQWSGLLPLWVDAVFETVSGLTTCGATVLASGDNPAPEAVPQSLLLWRALLQWIGGLGIVLLFGMLLSGTSSKRLLTVESVAIETDTSQPRATAQARAIAICYIALTLVCAGLLMLTGLSLFDGVCHAFTTLSTGGYSTRTSIATFDSLGAEIVLIFFMWLGGCSFAAMVATARLGGLAHGSILRSAEFRAYTAMTLGVTTLVTANLVSSGLGFGAALRQASFNVTSVLSGTGYATVDFQAWPAFCIVLLLVCLFVGGCSGSASGGFKQVRFVVCMKLIGYTVRHYVRPRSVERLKLEGDVLAAAAVSSVLAVVMLWLVCVILFAALYACDDRIGLLGALSTSASMQANAGPAMTAIVPESAAAALASPGVAAQTLGPNIGPLGGYAEMRTWAKAAMSVQMILGRLELLTLVAVLTPTFWRR